ncbi:MAG: PP2C family protein-serine/threonine phosphatase, partial [Mycobacterium sp.]
MSLTLRYAARSDVGLIRTNNEDAVYAGPRLLAVADGMGGHAAGDVASAVTIATLAPLDDDEPPADMLGALAQAIRQANDHLRQMMDADEELDGMGTTLTALLWSGGRLALAHIGDSRAYLLRDGELTQITDDHTLVQRYVDEGQLDEADIPTHPQRSVILRVLNGRPDDEADLSIREVREGDRYLICSDGLSGVVSKDTLRETLLVADPQETVDALVGLALRGGAPDNVTCIVCDVVDASQLAPAEPVVGGSVANGDDVRPVERNTAAGRAAALRGSRRPTARHRFDDEGPHRRWRGPLLALALLIVVAGALFGG